MRRLSYASDSTRNSARASRRRGQTRKLVGVTGGAGFIGSHLCDALVASGCEVVCIDSLQGGSLANVAHLASSNLFSLSRHDITKSFPKNLPQFDEIYNLACSATPSHLQADRIGAALTCALGALNVLERAERDGARVLQASSAQVYGDPDVHPQSEDYCGRVDPVGPRAGYDEGKRFAETLAAAHGDKGGLPAKIVRIFNTYGPRMPVDGGRAVSNFIVQALSGRDLVLHGDGLQTRSFCYVDDVVDGCLRMMASSDEVVGPVNLGHPDEITIAGLAETVLELTGSRSRIIYRPSSSDAARRRRPDIATAAERLGWRPRVGLREGLERTIEGFVQQLNATPEPTAPLAARV